ncbi:ABC transporter permease subunit [Cellulosimicrobium sp. PMB13]|uniref:ABC transporter permease subunit n=1 Tax=Cellulosimicrobium sp. PMB13 TaxID=3120158 RepID=UPI003F4BC556
MNRLVRAELRRYRARSAIRWLSVATVAVALLTVLVAFLGSRPTPPAEVAAAETAFAQQQEWWQDEGFAQCEEDEERARESDPAVDFGCESGEPRLEHFLMPVPTLEGEDDTWPPTGVQTLTTQLPFLALAGLVIGITFVTAELSTGAIGLWLTFEPRRRRVYWSKVAAAAVAVVPLAAVAALVMVGGAWGAYAANDQLGPVTAQTWTDLAGLSARAVVATAAFAAVGVALGTLVRHAAAAVGVVVGWLVLERLAVAALDELLRWSLPTNLLAWVQGGSSYWVMTCETDATGTTCEGVERVVSMAQGGLVVGGATVLLAVLAAVVFRRRDVS